MVSIYDPYSTKKNRLFVNSLDDLFDNKNIEIIFVCTPNYLNKKLTIESLQKEKHVFCEQPPGLNAKDIEDVIIAENKYKVCDLIMDLSESYQALVRKKKAA